MKSLSYKNTMSLILIFLFVFTAFSIAQEIETLRKGVVKISTTTFEGRQKIGTGFIVRQEKKTVIIVTASHVVEGSQGIDVEFFSARGRLFAAKVIGMEGGDPQGLAVISLTGEIPEAIPVLKMNSSVPVRAGDAVTIIGFPNAGGPWAVSKGEIIGRKGKIITFSGAIEEGNSGGPLLKDGEVIGIVVAAQLPFAAAVPSVIAQYFLESWGVKFAVQLRSEPGSVSLNYIIKMIQEKGFNHPADFVIHEVEVTSSKKTHELGTQTSERNIVKEKAEGIIGSFENELESRFVNEATVVIDHATGLMWQQSGTVNQMEWWLFKSYVKELNLEKFAGFSDWRLPTIDELASLMTPVGKNQGLYYISPLFDSRQKNCGSSDAADKYQWQADYMNGTLSPEYESYVRAVRTIQLESAVLEKPIDRVKLVRSDLSSKLLKNTCFAFSTKQNDTANIYIMKADGTDCKRLTDDATAIYFLTWSPDGNKIAYRSSWSDFNDQSKSGYFVMNRDGSDRLHLSNAKDNYGMLSWSPDGKKFIFTARSDNSREDLFTLNRDNTNLVQLTDTPRKNEYFPIWSPTGRKIAFYCDGVIYVKNIDGSDPIALTSEEKISIASNPPESLLMTWSPDGKKISFVAYTRGTFVIDADGTNLVRITDKSTLTPCWSPDGKKLTIVMGSDGFGLTDAADIYSVNVDGTDLRNLTQMRAKYDRPAWSPDGSKIVFASNRFGNWDIYMMNADGSDQVRLTDSSSDERKPVWSPFLK